MKTGVILILGEDESLGHPQPYATIRSWAMAAETAGLDSIWVYDHLLYHFEGKEPQGVWEGWTIGSALAEATNRVEIGTLVLCTAFRNPAVTAKMAVTLDEVSAGRLILGIGAGWHPAEFETFGLQFTRKVDQFEEATRIIAPLIREGAVDFTGEFHSAPNCIMLPKPNRPIPLLIAGQRPRMMGLTARYADAYNTCWHGGVSGIDTDEAALKSACIAEGRDFTEISFTAGVNVVLTDLVDPTEETSDPKKFLRGSVEEVAAGLRGYRDRGVSHVIANVQPLTPEGIGLLAEVAERAK